MKKFLLTNMIGLMAAQVALASTPKFWVDESEKTVVVAANPTLDVLLFNMNLEGDYYARLDINLQFQSKDIVRQFDAIMKNYPGYREQRVVLRPDGTYRLKIPLLNIDTEVKQTPGSEGPYYLEAKYISKAQYRLLRDAIKNKTPIVEITGSHVGTVPTTKVVERKELDPSVCTRIVGREQSVGGVITNTAMVNQAAAASQFEFDSTRVSLVEDIKANCFELQAPTEVKSIAEVMQIKIKAKNPGRNLVGETRQKTNSQEEVPLAYELNQREGSGE